MWGRGPPFTRPASLAASQTLPGLAAEDGRAHEPRPQEIGTPCWLPLGRAETEGPSRDYGTALPGKAEKAKENVTAIWMWHRMDEILYLLDVKTGGPWHSQISQLLIFHHV